MPLRDHFRSPLKLKHSWDKLHGGWPMVIVQYLFSRLPPGYVAAPNVHLGVAFEIDVTTHVEDDAAKLPELDEYEVLVYDEERGETLVAAVEIVSPSNKDRPESRRAFVAKVAALLQRDVCVSIVDLVTVRQFNLYADLLELLGESDPTLTDPPPDVYAVTLRRRKLPRKRLMLDAWFHPLILGQPLPTLPLWLDVDLAVPLDLEATYEDACRVLRIR